MSKWLAFCVVVVLSAHAARGRAQEDATTDVARAEGYAAEAFDAYSQQDFLRAVTLYRLALDAAASPDIIYNLARIYDLKLKDRALAIDFYQRYAADPGADPERARVASGRLGALREVERINGGSKRAPRAAAANGEAASPATQAAQALQAVQLGQASTAADDRHSGLSGLQVASIVVGAVGVAAIGIGIGFGIDAKTNADVSHELCNGNSCTTPRGVDAARSASSSATVSTIAIIAGGALLAAGVTTLIVSSSVPGERGASAQLVPYADRSGGGAQWIGRW